MANKVIKCVFCENGNVRKNAKHPNNRQHYKCKKYGKPSKKNTQTTKAKPKTKSLIVKMSLNSK
jgi:transposase-like protein